MFGPSAVNTYTTNVGDIDNLDDVSVVVTTPAGCTETTLLTMFENVISTVGTLTTVSNTICSGETASIISGSTSLASGTITYEWQNSSDNITYSAITGTNSTSYEPGTLATTMFFKRKTISTLNGVVCEQLSNALRIDVTATPPANILANPGTISGNSSMTICDGDEVVFTGSGGASYEFTVDNITRQVRSNQSTFTTTSLLNNEVVRVIVYDQLTGTSACNSTSDPITVNVTPIPTVTLSSDATGDTFCAGDEVNFTATSSVASATYSFSIGGTVRQTGATPTFTPTDYVAFLNDGDQIAVTVTSLAGCSASTSITLSQNLVTPGTIQTASLTICSGGTPSALTNLVTATGSGSITYEWEAALGTASFVIISGANGPNYSPSAITSTTRYRRKAISTFNGAICEDYSNILTINVTPPIVGGTISPTIETICSGDTPSLITVTGGSTGPLVTYQWQISTDGITYNDIVTATAADYQPARLNATRYYKRITNAVGGSPASCTDESSVIQINVIDVNAGALAPTLDADYCFGTTPPTLVSSITGGIPADGSSSSGTVTYRWEMSTDNTNWSIIPGANSNFYNPPSLIQTTWFKRVITATIGVDFCEAETTPIRIGILAELTEGTILDDQTICQVILASDLPRPLELRGAEAITASLTYQWQRSTDQFTWQDITGQQTANLNFALGDAWLPTIPATYYRAVITSVGDPVPAAIESTSVILRNTINTFANGQEYAIAINGTNYAVTASTSSTLNSVGTDLAALITANSLLVNASFNTTNGIISIIPVTPGTYNVAASTGSPDPILASIIPSTASALEMKVLVSGNNGARTPNAGLATCQVYTDMITIEVNDQPTLTQINGDPSPQEVCIGDPIDPITFTFTGATSVEIRNLDTNLTITPLGGGAVNAIAGLNGWYTISGTNTFTISGNASTTTNFTIITQGSSCTTIQEQYMIRTTQAPIRPDFIRKDVNQMGYEVIEAGGVWYNNTVCQDRLPAPTTAPTEFFTCFIDNQFNLQFGDYDWDVSPSGAGSIVENNFFQKRISVTRVSAPIAGQTYTATLTNATGTVTSYTVTSTAAIQTPDNIGLALANAIDASTDYDAIYNNVLNEVRIESTSANNDYTVNVAPNNATQSTRLGNPIPFNWIRSATMNWDPTFSGEATIRVRTEGCGISSPWRQISVDVVPEQIPAAPLSDLSIPIAIDQLVCGGQQTGDIPECQITTGTLPTQFFSASVNAANDNDYASLEWQISNPQPGSGSSVGSPGTIVQETGILSWNPGWWGSFELQVRPISCTGVIGNWTSRTIVIGEQDGPIVISNFGNPLPECPIPAGGFSTTLSTVGSQGARWFVNSPAGLALTTNYIASATFFELTPTDASSSSINLDFRPGFSGNIIITAEPVPCPGDRVNYVIAVPGPPQIMLTSAGSTANQTLCNNTALTTITYDIEGAADRVLVRNLPAGVIPSLSLISQVTSITVATVTDTTVGQNYSLSINNQRFDFTTTAALANADDHIGQGLATAVNSTTTDFVATYTSGNIAITVGPTGAPGSSYIISTTQPINSSINFGTPISQPLSKVFTIAGTPSDTGSFTFVVETEAPATGCETAVSTGTIILEEDASLSIVTGFAPLTEYCGVEDVSGANAIVMTFDGDGVNDIRLSPTSPNPLPNGLTLGLQPGFADRYIIQGTMNQIVAAPIAWDVDFTTNGASCNEDTLRITFNLVPQPVATLTSSGTGDRTACSSTTITSIRYEIANPAFALQETATSTFPPGISGQVYAQQQEVQFLVDELVPAGVTSNMDTFTVNLNGTVYSAVPGTEMPSNTQNLSQLIDEFVPWLQAQVSPTYTIIDNDPNITIRSNFAGVAFTASVFSTSAGLRFDSGSLATTQSPAYYEISGTIDQSAVVSSSATDYIYVLESAGAGTCVGSIAASGTISVNPSTFGTYLSGEQNPAMCVGETSSVTFTTNAALAIAVVTPTTPSWITASYNLGTGEINVSINPPASLIVTNTQVFNYEINLIGNAFGCFTTPSPISGSVTLFADDTLTFIGVPGDEAQVICVNNDPVSSSFTPIEYSLDNGAIGQSVTASYSMNGGVYQSGLPPGFTIITTNNSVTIAGVAIPASAVATAASTVYEYVLTTGGGCNPATASGTIEVVSDPTLTLTSSSTTNNQVICDGTPIANIIYERGGGANGFLFSWTGANSSTIQTSGLTFTTTGTNEYIVFGTPTVNVTQSTIFTYQIVTTGSLCATEVIRTGSIQIDPIDSISLVSSPTTDSQEVCYMDRDNAGNALTELFIPIEYQLGGGAIGQNIILTYNVNGGATQNGLPSGLGYTVNASNTLIISGSITASTTFTTPTVTYNYQVATSGTCSTSIANGTLTVRSIPVMSLVSTTTSSNQVICDATAMQPIIYEIAGGATAMNFSWTGANSSTIAAAGLTTTNSGTNQFVISGSPTTNVTQTTIFTYQIETTGSACTSEVILTGSLQIDPIDSISLVSSPTTDSQEVCYMDRDNAGNALTELFIPIEYQLGGGAIGQNIILTYNVNGGATQNGLPSGLGYTVNASNTLIISGSITASTTFTTPTVTYNYQVATSGTCSTSIANGTLTVRSIPVMSLVSTTTSSNQVICDATAMQPIIYEIAGGATAMNFSWTGANSSTIAAAGLTTTNSGTNQFVISGSPTTNVTQTTIFTYQIETTGSACTSEVILTGSLQVEPTDMISLISSPTSNMQSVCLFDNDNPLNAIAENFTPIEYQLSGGAVGAPVSFIYRVNGGPILGGLPAGLGYTRTSSETIIINGTVIASTTFTSPTVTYTYELTTGGGCSTTSLSGAITVHSPPIFTLTSSLTTTNQTGFASVCDQIDPIQDIVYTFAGGATNAVFSWTGSNSLNGVNGNIAPGTQDLIISGTPSVNITQTTTYPYEVRTLSSACGPEIVYTGVIEVKPRELLTLVSSATTVNQTICVGTSSNTLEPIIYNLEQDATSAVVTFTPPLPGVGYTVTASQVIISGFASSSAQVSNTSTPYIYEVRTTGCGPAVETGTIIVDPMPEMILYSGSPNQALCNNTEIASITYVFNPASNATYNLTWDSVPPGINASLSSVLGGVNNAVIISGTPSAAISVTTTYNYDLTLTGYCAPQIIYSGSFTLEPSPMLDPAVNAPGSIYVTDVSCAGGADGSILLGDPSDPSFLNIIPNLNPGIVQESNIVFTGTVTATDIFRVFINGYTYEKYALSNSTPTLSAYTRAQIIGDLVVQINNDPLQTNVSASSYGAFGIGLSGIEAGLPFIYNANASSLSAITTTATTTQAAVAYGAQLNWTYPNGTTNTGANITNLEAGVYLLEIANGTCPSSTYSFTLTEPDPIDPNLIVCSGEIYVQPEGGTGPYTAIIRGRQLTSPFNYVELYNQPILPGTSFTWADPLIERGRDYNVIIRDSQGCESINYTTVPLNGFNLAGSLIQQGRSYCSTGTLGTGYIETLYQSGLNQVNAITGGSGIYEYAWVQEPFPGVISTSPNIYNLAPGDYTLTVTDTSASTCYDSFTITVQGYDTLTFAAVTQPPFFSAVSSGTVDYVYELQCIGDTDASFRVFATGASGNYNISSTGPPITLNNGLVSNAGPGTYVFTVSDANPPINPITGLAYIPCEETITVEVLEPDTIELTEDTSARIQPNCIGDLPTGGRLVFTIENFDSNRAPYTVLLNGGVLTLTAATASVIFDNIDVNDPRQQIITDVEVRDIFGCTTDMTTSPPIMTGLPQPFRRVDEFTVDVVTNNIECNEPNSGLVEFTMGGDSNALANLLANPVQLQVFGQSVSYNNYYILSDFNPFAIATITQQDTYGYIVSTTGGSSGTCIIDQGTFDIQAVGGDTQISIAVTTTLAGCENSESVISLTSSNTVGNIFIDWFEKDTGGLWNMRSDLSGQAIVVVPPGEYYAVLTDSRLASSTCSTNTVSTREILIPEQAPISIIENRLLRVEPRCAADLATGATLVFTIENYLPAKLPYTIELNGGAISASTPVSPTSGVVSITNIDVKQHPSITSASIIDADGCTTTATINITFPVIDTYTVGITTNPIDCASIDSGKILIDPLATATSTDFTAAAPGFLYIKNAATNPFGFRYITTLENMNTVSVTVTEPGDYIYELSSVSSATCLVATGTFTIGSITSSNVITVSSPTITLAGCENSESVIDLGTVSGIVLPVNIAWEYLSDTVTTSGGVTQTISNWTSYDNGSLDNNLVITVPSGVYRAVITDDRDTTNTTSDCATNTLITSPFVVDEGLIIDVVETPNSRITPRCPADLIAGAELSFDIVNFDPANAPYTVSILNGILTQNAATASPVVFAIDVLDPDQRTIEEIEIVDVNGCSKTVSLSITFPEVNEYTVNVVTNDIDCSTGSTGQVLFDITSVNPLAEFDNINAGFLEIRGNTSSFEYFKRIPDMNTVSITFAEPDTYTYALYSNNSILCSVATGTFTVSETRDTQIDVTIQETLQGCDNDQSTINLTINNAIAPFTIRWFVKSETVILIGTAPFRVASTVISYDPYLGSTWDDNADITNVTPGTYRAMIVDDRGVTPATSGCSTNTYITRDIVIPEVNQLDLVEYEELRIMPICPNDLAAGAEIHFGIEGYEAAKAPYTVFLNGGVLQEQTTTTSLVIFDLDVTDETQRTLNSATIVDNTGCAQTVTLTIEFPIVSQYDVDVTASPIDCSLEDSGSINFDVFARDAGGRFTINNPAQLYIRARNRPFESYLTITNNNSVTINVEYADTYDYVLSINSSNTCEVVSGFIEVEEANNAQLNVNIDVIQPGCGTAESRVTLDIPNYVAPLTIQWYEYVNVVQSEIVSVTTPAGTTTTTRETSVPSWILLSGPKYDYNPSIVTGLEPGIYRAIVTDGRVSECGGGQFITRNINISESSLGVTNFRTVENLPAIGGNQCVNYPNSIENITWTDTSDQYTSDVFFSVAFNVRRNTNFNGIDLELQGPDGSFVDLANNPNIYGLALPTTARNFRFRNLPAGPYILTITEVASTTEFVPCREDIFFTIETPRPIEYTGQTEFQTDICTGAVLGGIQASAIGGEPFIVDGAQTYQFEWTYTSNDPGASPQLFYGDIVEPAYPGEYCLRILDSNAHSYCSCEDNGASLTITVEDVVQPFRTSGNLTDPNNPGTVVKSLPPDCSGGGLNGQISILVNGGQLPYTINWFAEDPRYLNANSAIGYRPLDGTNGSQNFTNRTSLDGLLPGNYKMIITSDVDLGCANDNQYTRYEEIIQVSPNRELYIMDGPYVDEDLCGGQQGRLIVDIFDNNNGNLSFYYNDILIPNSDIVRLSDRSWSVAIVNAIDSADFRIVNEEGCWITTEINRGIGEPNFRYSSPNFNASSVILAREEITFENTSTDPYVTSEWIFGDNTPAEIVPTLVDSIIPVRHAYGVSGTYFTTLRIYNDIGCSEEITYPISVGKGYNLMVPNVFTPNNDLVNDNFRPLFSGFSSMTFTVYDYRGNVVFNEYVEEADLNNIQGISITGWDGNLAPYSPYFIYTAYGILLDGETEVEKSGTFILIN